MRGIMVCLNDRFTEIKSIGLLKLPVKESEILKRSKLVYSEDEPCVIYRTAIINKLGLELMEKLQNTDLINSIIGIETAKEIMGDTLDFPIGTEYIKFI